MCVPFKPMVKNVKDCKTILELRIITDLLIKFIMGLDTRRGTIKVCSDGSEQSKM